MAEQLNLLNIKQQPEPRPGELKSATIRAYVKQALRGFPERQAERERQRTEARDREPLCSKRKQFEMFPKPDFRRSNMKTAQELAAAAASITQMANAMRPADDDPFAQQRKLIVYHLISAASKARELAEAMAQGENS